MEEAKVYLQEHATIYGHDVFHRLISVPELAYDIHVIEWEGKGFMLENKMFMNDNERAEHYFGKICREMLKGMHI